MKYLHCQFYRGEADSEQGQGKLSNVLLKTQSPKICN